MFFYNLGSKSILVLNSGKAAFDLLNKRSGIYSDRQTTVIGVLSGQDKFPSRITYDDPDFTKYRRLFRKELGPDAAKRYWTLQEDETKVYLKNLSEDPQNFFNLIRR